ncbi:hypothetical protein, partial [Salinibacter sp.]|uniref:hypothetical protein n=1 Tax=Salinibacter sp. TaxID=2065818 RepID=UPI0021E82A24
MLPSPAPCVGLLGEGRVFVSTVALFLIGSLAGGGPPARAQEGPPPDTTAPDTTAHSVREGCAISRR